MKKLFAVGVVGVILFEIANVYFVMPLPGSQRMRSIDVAYLIYSWRWVARAAFGAAILAGAPAVWRTAGWRRWLMPLSLLVAGLVVYVVNFQMAADHLFRQPTVLTMQPSARNAVALDRLVVGIEINGDARAYPLQFIGYHHQVQDTVGAQHVLVSYCTVCRTGRVFTPVVDGRLETFRLVGMDQFNVCSRTTQPVVGGGKPTAKRSPEVERGPDSPNFQAFRSRSNSGSRYILKV